MTWLVFAPLGLLMLLAVRFLIADMLRYFLTKVKL